MFQLHHPHGALQKPAELMDTTSTSQTVHGNCRERALRPTSGLFQPTGGGAQVEDTTHDAELDTGEHFKNVTSRDRREYSSTPST